MITEPLKRRLRNYDPTTNQLSEGTQTNTQLIAPYNVPLDVIVENMMDRIVELETKSVRVLNGGTY